MAHDAAPPGSGASRRPWPSRRSAAPSALHIRGSSAIEQPWPPRSFGTPRSSRRSFLSASIASVGNRRCGRRRTCGRTRRPPRSRACRRLSRGGSSLSVQGDRSRRVAPSVSSSIARADGGDALEDAASQHPVGELDVEFALEREHHVHAGVGGHARLVEIAVLGERRGVRVQAAVFLQNGADLFGHLRGAEWGVGEWHSRPHSHRAHPTPIPHSGPTRSRRPRADRAP